MVRISRVRASAAAGISVALAAVALAPAPASAWERPVALTPGTPGIEGPILAVNPAGDAVLAWGRGVGTSEEIGLPVAWRVEASTRPAGAPAWSPAERLSPPGELGFAPWPAMLPSGSPVVAWTTARRGVLETTASEAGGGLRGWTTTPLDLESGAWDDRGAATAPDGTLAVAEASPWWTERRTLRVRVRAPEGTWREAPPVEPPPPDQSVEIAVRPGGRVLLAWLGARGEWGAPDARAWIVTREWDPAAGWAAPVRGDELPGAANVLRLAVAADGTELALVDLRSGEDSGLVGTSRAPGAAWTPARTLGHPGLGDVLLAVSPSRGAVAAWDDADVLRMSTWRPGDGWSAPETAPAGTCVRPQIAEAVAMGAGGEALLVASAGFTDQWHHGLARAWTRRPDGTWLGPVWLSRASAGSTVAAVDGSGRMHVAWNRESDLPSRVEVTSTDPAGAGIDAVPGEPVATVSRVRVLARGRGAVTVRFRLSRPARVAVELRPAAGGARVGHVRSRGRRGPNAVALRLDGRRPVRPGWYVGSVWHERSFLWGCAVASPRVRIG